jgi:5'-phosphate synthase pdxT subunit
MRVGVLALQGGFAAHLASLDRLGHSAKEVRTVRDLDGVDGLVLPGGESSVMLDLLAREVGLEQALRARIASGMPLLATCAGLILSAREVRAPSQRSFAFLDVVVRRNAYGRQLDSKETRDDRDRIPLVLIRAPKIESVGPAVEILATHEGDPVLVREGPRVGATFHPELTDDLGVHALAFGSTAR